MPKNKDNYWFIMALMQNAVTINDLYLLFR